MNMWQKATNIVRWYHERDGATMDDAVNALMEAFSIERDEYRRKAQLLRQALGQCRELFSDICGDWSDPRTECREGWRIIGAALRETGEPEESSYDQDSRIVHKPSTMTASATTPKIKFCDYCGTAIGVEEET